MCFTPAGAVAGQHVATVLAATTEVKLQSVYRAPSAAAHPPKVRPLNSKRQKDIMNVSLKWPQIHWMVRFLLLACESLQDLWATYTSQTQNALCRCLETNRESFKRLGELLDETFADSQSVTNVFRMLHPAPCE